jgi:hypothetical protein
LPELPDVDETVGRMEALLAEFDGEDARARQRAEELIRLLMQLYGAGLCRIVEMLRQRDPLDAVRLADDKLVGSLLLLHGLHPETVEERVRKALLRLERRLESHRLVLDGITDGVARIAVEGKAVLPAALGEIIEKTIAEFAPDIAGVEIEGLAATPSLLVQIAPAPVL